MKDGTQYAKRIKRLQQEWQSKFGKQAIPEVTDPIEQLVLGILARNTTEAKAQAVFARMKQEMVDLNELRVTPTYELADIIGKNFPFALDKARRILAALNEIRRQHDTLDLSMLAERGRRDARAYLDSLEGVDAGTAARVMLLCFDAHAIPVDELTVMVLRRAKAVDPDAEVGEVQSFLERNISAAECKHFVMLMWRYVASESSHVNSEKLHAMVKPLESKTASGNMMADAARAAEAAALEAEARLAKAAEAKAAAKAAKHKPAPEAKPAKAAVAESKPSKSAPEGKSVKSKAQSKPTKTEEAGKGKAAGEVKSAAPAKPAKDSGRAKPDRPGRERKAGTANAGKSGKSVEPATPSSKASASKGPVELKKRDKSKAVPAASSHKSGKSAKLEVATKTGKSRPTAAKGSSKKRSSAPQQKKAPGKKK